ncbi:hypothetical protein XENTR_v10010919 [Xenopus tropicalis]|nr:hypothetical protein XENTR_v10010919 [Xenopus tropicalis]
MSRPHPSVLQMVTCHTALLTSNYITLQQEITLLQTKSFSHAGYNGWLRMGITKNMKQLLIHYTCNCLAIMDSMYTYREFS